jgi:hypothetical protein
MTAVCDTSLATTVTLCSSESTECIDRSLKLNGTTVSGTGGPQGGTFGESTGPVESTPRNAPLGGN